jgi:predicted GNAT family N-acyltransferase
MFNQIISNQDHYIPSEQNTIKSLDISYRLALNTHITDDLRNEGILTDIKRLIQQERKNKKLQIGELVSNIKIRTNNELILMIIEDNKDDVLKSVSAKDVNVTIDKKLADNVISLGNIKLEIGIIN